MANPAGERNPVLYFPTASLSDVLFYEYRDSALPKNKPEYGSPHPDTQKWPNHKLAFVSPAENVSPGLQKWWYVANREDQDEYNYTFSKADIGGVRFDTVSRVYVTPRDEFVAEERVMGSAMENTPEDVFENQLYILAEHKQIHAQEEIDALFVIEQVSYICRAAMSEVKLDIQTGNSKRAISYLYYRGEVVYNTSTIEALAANPSSAYWGLQSDGIFRELNQISDNWFQVTESQAVPSNGAYSAGNPAKSRVRYFDTPVSATGVGLSHDVIFTEVGTMPSIVPIYGTAHYNATNFSGYKLALIEPADATGLLYKFTYIKDRSNQANYNWEISEADIGGVKFNAIKRTYVTPRSSFTAITPTMGTALASNDPISSKVTNIESFVLAERQQVRSGDEKFDKLYVIDVHTYVQTETMYQVGYDETFGGYLQGKQILMYKGKTVQVGSTTPTIESIFSTPNAAYWGVQSDGWARDGKQLTTNWFLVTEKQVVPTEVATTGRTYDTVEEFYWPAVLSGFQVDTWPRRPKENESQGGEDVFTRPIFKREAYRGPCKALVHERFYKTQQTIDAPNVMMPETVIIASPFMSVNTGPCLHAAIDLPITSGTNHPIYKYTGGNYEYLATDPPDWDASVTASEVQIPFRGGYLVRKVVVYQPTYAQNNSSVL